MRFITLAAAVAAAGMARGALAQSAQRPPAVDSLPRELVQALVRPYSINRDMEFYVGELPPSLAPFFYVPRNARILGGMTSTSGVTAVLHLPPGSEDVATMYHRELPKLGWTPPLHTSDPRGWGFVPAPYAAANGGLEFCHIGQSLQLIPEPDGAGGTQLTALVQMNAGGSCAASGARVEFVGRPPQAALPTLTNPAGTTMNSPACFQPTTGGRSNASSERVQTSLSPAQLLDVFARQLADSGWTTTPAAASAHRVWTHADSAGASRELMVSANPIPGTTCYEVQMVVREMPAPVKR
jgi:hypothetical protein